MTSGPNDCDKLLARNRQRHQSLATFLVYNVEIIHRRSIGPEQRQSTSVAHAPASPRYRDPENLGLAGQRHSSFIN
jgi:hypothetical protein